MSKNWVDELENAFDSLTDEQEAWIESRYELLENHLLALQKEEKYGRDDIDQRFVQSYIDILRSEDVSESIAKAFLFHWFYDLD